MRTRSMALVAFGALLPLTVTAMLWWPTENAGATEVTVYKTATCGCCGKWVEHLEDRDFSVTTKNVHDLSNTKAHLGVPAKLSSCHTAVVEGYVVEGHVPADVIQRLITERPPVTGIAVPGMPAGSPGMEVGYRQPYDVLTFDEAGKTEVYSRQR